MIRSLTREYIMVVAKCYPLYVFCCILTSFTNSEFYPIEESVDGGANAPIKMGRTEHGGHLGYMFHHLSDKEKKRARSTSWMPTELSRFISHVHSYNEDSIKS